MKKPKPPERWTIWLVAESWDYEPDVILGAYWTVDEATKAAEAYCAKHGMYAAEVTSITIEPRP